MHIDLIRIERLAGRTMQIIIIVKDTAIGLIYMLICVIMSTHLVYSGRLLDFGMNGIDAFVRIVCVRISKWCD